jgi:hypothetical protein
MVAAVEKLQEEEGEREEAGEMLMREGVWKGKVCAVHLPVAGGYPFSRVKSHWRRERGEGRGDGCAVFRKRDECSLLGHVFFSWDA